MSRYGLSFPAGPDWEGDAPSLREAIRRAEAETGRRVIRGRGLDHYVALSDVEAKDRREAYRAVRRAIADNKNRGMRIAAVKSRASALGIVVAISPSGHIALLCEGETVVRGDLINAEVYLGSEEPA